MEAGAKERSADVRGTGRAQQGVAEFTAKAIACGLGFGVLFGGANAYLGLKAGLTVSTSIPIAVLSVAMFRMFSKGGTILEANMAQTIGSASSSLASGTIFTIPALFMWGIAPPVTQAAVLALCGGLLGILAMVPLRRLLIVQADAELPYPEGRACANVLQASESEGAGGRWILIGLVFGGLVKLVIDQFHWVPEKVTWLFGDNASLAVQISPALLAVGFIIGFRAAAVMVTGGFIASLVLYPLVTKAYAGGVASALAQKPIQELFQVAGDPVPTVAALSAKQVKDQFLVFVGAGAVAAAALVTILRTGPTMVRSLLAVLKGLRQGSGAAEAERTDRDIPAWMLLAGIALVVFLLALVPGVLAGDLAPGTRVAAALGAAFFSVLFVPVSSRLVGVIGVSSNPTSAMALITLAGTAGIFSLFGWTGMDARAAVLTVGTVVCIAASKAGDISQDLKTGYIVKATPALQQYGQLIAAAVACWAVAAIVVSLGHGQGFGEGGLAAPQATLMKTVVEAVLGEQLPWDMLAMGGALSLSAALTGLPALSFALGVYLPLATLAAVFVGGLVRKLVEARKRDSEMGILCASGFVAGEGLAGVLIVGWAIYKKLGRYSAPEPTTSEVVIAIVVLVAILVLLYRSTRRAQPA